MKDCGIDMNEDNSIETIAYDIDDFILKMITKYKTDPLIFGSVVLARLTLTNDYFGSGEDFRKLMKNVPKMPSPTRVDIH
jgi:hypothetical protein